VTALWDVFDYDDDYDYDYEQEHEHERLDISGVGMKHPVSVVSVHR
jgi:hypothetical protein